MNSKGLLIVVLVNCVLLAGLFISTRQRVQKPQASRPMVPVSPIPEQEEFPPWVLPSPKWTVYPPLRQVTNLGIVLSDIESHMPANHIYKSSDKITWAHETSHGLASNIRQKFSRAGYVAFVDELPVFHSADKINGFYVLKDRAIVLHEPKGTLTSVANAVPKELRGEVYGLYLQKAISSWNDEPLYVCDEWVAYTNGSATRADLKITDRAETVRYMVEFSLYAICMLKATQADDEVKTFVKWQLERVMQVRAENEKTGTVSNDYWKKVQGSSEISAFCCQCFGQEWSQKVLGLGYGIPKEERPSVIPVPSNPGNGMTMPLHMDGIPDIPPMFQNKNL